jgi:hypothetical protein
MSKSHDWAWNELEENDRAACRTCGLVIPKCKPFDEVPKQAKRDPGGCPHTQFSANVAVNRIEDKGQFMADIRVECTDCGTPFQFLGLEPGIDTHGARVSLDGLEARIALTPNGVAPNPLQRLSFNVNKFDG